MSREALSAAIRKYRMPEYDLSCSESTLHAVNEVYALNLDSKALKMMAGFSGGLMSEDLCGALVGGVAALSVLLTDGVAHQSPELKVAVQAYLAKVDNHFGARMCVEIKKTHRDQALGSCNPVIFDNADLLAQVIDSYVDFEKKVKKEEKM